jgi:hypothetical protein
MKKALLLVGLGLCLAVVAVAGIDFSGTWVFDAAKSDQGGGGGGRGGGAPSDLTITQTGNDIGITSMRGGNPMETKYIMDGAEHSVEAPAAMKYKAVLSGDTLAITGTRTTRGGEMPLNTKYTLSADGKTLTVANTTNMQGQETVRKQVFNKK